MTEQELTDLVMAYHEVITTERLSPMLEVWSILQKMQRSMIYRPITEAYANKNLAQCLAIAPPEYFTRCAAALDAAGIPLP